MKRWFEIFRNVRGMSTTEMIVAGGLAGAAALGVAAMMKNMGGSSRDAEIVIERTEFGSALGVFLNSANGCFAFKQGPAISTSESAYTTPDWVGMDGKPKSFGFDGFKNFRSEMDLRYNKIKTLVASRMDIPNVNPLTLKIGANVRTLKKAVVKVKLAMVEKSILRNPADKLAEENKFSEARFEYNIPVLVDSSTNVVEICGDNTNMAESCFLLKGTFETDTGICNLPVSCENAGSYAILDCAPKIRGVNCQAFANGRTPFVNPVTNMNSCPTGYNAVSTGGDTWWRDVDCGKKCTQRVNYSIGYYSCLKCL